VIRDRAWKRWGKVTRVVAAEKTRERIGNICRNTTIDERTRRVMILSMLQVDERVAGELFDAFEDCHQSWDTLGLIQGDGSPGVTPLRPGGICGVLHLDFVWPTCAVLWRDYRGAPLFLDQDVGADCPCLVEESRTTCAEEFGDVYSRCTYELILAADRNLVRRHGVV